MTTITYSKDCEGIITEAFGKTNEVASLIEAALI